MIEWLKDVFLARRRLRELRNAYEQGLERWRADRVAWKREVAAAREKVAQADRWVWNHKEELARKREFEDEANRLRKLNGETQSKYVRALEDRDRALGRGPGGRMTWETK